MLKGKTTIELTDVHTGEKETVVEENMITNALSHIFNDNIEGMLWYVNTYGQIWKDVMIPICPNTLGGILLFSNELEEDAENLYAPSGNPCVGYASNDVNSTADTFRGSLNLTESGKIEGGYKFVWDFTTSQANGTISAVALTHKLGGISFMGDEFSTKNTLMMKNNETSYDPSKSEDLWHNWRYLSCVEIDFDNNLMVSIVMKKNGDVLISKMRKDFRKLTLTGTLSDNGYEKIVEEVNLTPQGAFVKSDSYQNKEWPYYDFIDGKDGYWYGFLTHVSSNNKGDAMIRWIKIRKDDYTFTEGTWNFENVQLYQIGYTGAYQYYDPEKWCYSAIRNGYLYVFNYTRNGLYKIALNNPADITLIPLGFTSASPQTNYGGGTVLYVWQDYLIGTDFWLDTNDVVHKRVALHMGQNYTNTPLFQYGVYALSFGVYYYNTSTARIYRVLRLMTPYLASINNLGTSVIKTADKTMKITYTVTETE